MTTIAQLMVEVGANIGGFSQSMNEVDNRLSGISSGLTNMGNRMLSAGAQLGLLATPLYAIGAGGIRAASGFEDVINQVAVFGGLAGDELETVRQAALQMGADTAFSASDAAGALLELVKAGQTVDEAMASVTSTLDLAAVGEMGMAEAAGILSSGLAAFGLEANQASRVSNALARAASASRADVRGLGQALSNAAPVAATFGLSIEQTSAALGVFENVGISGAEAGTQLRSMLLTMSQDTEAVSSAWEALGTTMYDAEGNMRDFDLIIDDISAGLEGMPAEEQNRVMQDLAGSYGIVGLNALVAAGGIDGMLAAMDGAPSATETAQAAMGTFSGKVEALKGSVETLMINALTPLMDNVLTPMATKLTDVVNKVNEWALANPQLTSSIVGMLGGFSVLPPALAVGGYLFRSMGTAVGLLGSALGLITSPLAIVAGLFVGVLAVGGTLNDVLTAMGGFVETVKDNIGNLTGGLDLLLAGDYEGGLGLISTGLSNIAGALADTAVTTLEAFVGAIENITGLDLPSLSEIGTALRDGLNWLTAPLAGAWESLSAGISGFGAALSGIDSDGVEQLGQIASAIGSFLSYVLAFPVDVISGVMTGLGNNLPVLGQGLASLVGAVGDLLAGKADLGATLESMGNGLLTVITSLGGAAVEGLGTGLITFLERLTGADLPTVQEIWSGFVTAIEGLPAQLGIAAENVQRALEGFFLNAQLEITTQLGNLRQAVLEGTGVDIAPNLDVDREAIRTRVDELAIENYVIEELRARMQGETLNLDETFVFEMSGQTVTGPFIDAVRLAAEGEMPAELFAVLQQAVNTANETDYNSLMDLVTALNIPLTPIRNQVQTAINSAVAEQFNTTATVNVQIETVVQGGGGGSAGLGGYADGGYVPRTGLALLHAGEYVLTDDEVRAARGRVGLGGGGSQFVINAYGNSPQEVADLVVTALRDRGF
jgi:TP901 family phage tail tape measure protein